MLRDLRALCAALALALAGLTAIGGPAAAEVADDTAATFDGTGSVSGTVTGPEGADLTQVRVTVSAVPGYGQSWEVAVQSDGTYAVTGLAPGSYLVSFRGSDAGLLDEYWDDVPAHVPNRAETVTVASGPVTGVDAELTGGGVLSGTVLTDSDCDLSEVVVEFFEGRTRRVVARTFVEPDGFWSLGGVPAGLYQVFVDGRYAGLPRIRWQPAGIVGDSWIVLDELRRATDLDVRLDGPVAGCVGLRPYVAAVYEDLLGRFPDDAGLEGWAGALAGGTPYAAVANGITASDEFRSGLIQDAYDAYLGRGPDAAGLADWLAQMRTGRHIESIEAGFIASDEFYARYGSTPAGWIAGLYETVLGREPSSAEVQSWVGRMASGASRFEVAGGFLYSTEHLTAVIDGYYVYLLGRHIDPEGRTTWVRLIQGGHRDEEIIAGIVASQEYMAGVAWR